MVASNNINLLFRDLSQHYTPATYNGQDHTTPRLLNDILLLLTPDTVNRLFKEATLSVTITKILLIPSWTVLLVAVSVEEKSVSVK